MQSNIKFFYELSKFEIDISSADRLRRGSRKPCRGTEFVDVEVGILKA